MPAGFDDSDFEDSDYQAAKKTPYSPPSARPSPSAAGASRPPSREELSLHLNETQQKLAELKRAQEALEQKRAALEEERRRQMEFQTGRQEMTQNLTRGVGLLEEAEFAARRDAEQMTRTLVDLRLAAEKVNAIHEETWTHENYSVELTRALTTVENARMEWNASRLKWPLLAGAQASSKDGQPETKNERNADLLTGRGFGELCKLGLAFTWPLVVSTLLLVVVLLLKK